ncbi:MAG: BphX family protein [Chloroflexota bacterium]|nr:BphX family protein [Chloroflexota bacterium]
MPTSHGCPRFGRESSNYKTKTKWWLRIVGTFYLLLALMSLWVVFINPQLFGAMFPFSANDLSLRAFSDAWLIFVLEMGVLGVIMLYAARKPAHNGILVLTVPVLELIRGAGGDLLWMSRGWPIANYIPFMIVHLIIAGTGLFFLRQESQ